MTLSDVDPIGAHPAPRTPWSPTGRQRIRWSVRRQRGPLVRYWAADFTLIHSEPQRMEPWPAWARNAPRRLWAALRFGGVRQVTTEHYAGDVSVSGPTVYPDVCAPAPPAAE